jgi:hypothetical protein
MKITQKQYIAGQWKEIRTDTDSNKVRLVFVFGSKEFLIQQERYNEIRNMFPNSSIISCSTSGEIIDAQIYDDTLSLTAIEFSSSYVKAYQIDIGNTEESESIGRQLGEQLDQNGLKHVMVYADGIIVNGTELLRGVQAALPEHMVITGGSAGDGDRFKETYVGLNGIASQNKVIIVGFYGDNLTVSYGSEGGWDIFGITRRVTKSIGRTVYELDNKPILDIYKEYLGDAAKNLPSSGLAFPLYVTIPGLDIPLVRTMMEVNEQDKTVTFAGGVPEGSYAQLMRGNVNHLIDGAENAAEKTVSMYPDKKAQLALLVSCVGRRLVFNQRIEEGLSATRDVFDKDCVVTGFYSYGEFTPNVTQDGKCQFQNQTITITAFHED